MTKQIEDGLTGDAIVDTAGKGAPDSRTPTGLSTPQPLDNALAWVALWGLAALATVPKLARPSCSVGVDPAFKATHPPEMAIPLVTHPIAPALWRELAASAEFARAAFGPSQQAAAGRDWMRSHRVHGLVRFQIRQGGSASAPERIALPGRVEVF